MLYDPKWEVKIDSSVVEILRSAKNIISDPAHWTCETYARDAGAREIGVECRAAISFCSIGALARALGVNTREAEDSDAYGNLEAAAEEQGYPYPHDLNDKAGHARAMEMFDRAIELASLA